MLNLGCSRERFIKMLTTASMGALLLPLDKPPPRMGRPPWRVLFQRVALALPFASRGRPSARAATPHVTPAPNSFQ